MSMPQFETIDPGKDPDRANAAVASLLADPVPLMQIPQPRAIKLTAGWFAPDGEVYADAEVRELTGEDEEFIARETRRQGLSGALFTDTILRRAVTRLGTADEVTPLMLDTLLVGDRNQLVLEIRRQTFGDDWAVEGLICRRCTKPFDVVIELGSDIKYRPMDDPRKRTMEVELRRGGKAVLRLVTGMMHRNAVGNGEKTGAEETTAFIDQCLMSIDGVMVTEPLGGKLGMADRKTLMTAINTSQPGPLLEEVSVPCSLCGFSSEYSVGLVDLFRI